MTNRTQCPECFTVFMITDEQLIRSKGKVRCGHCRNTFNAQLMSVKVGDDLIKPGAANTIQNEPNDIQATKPDAASQPEKNFVPLANPKQKTNSTSAETSTDKEYTSTKEISSSAEISYRSDMLGGFTEPKQTKPIADEPSQTQPQYKKSARLFSEAMQAIDDTPNFNLDAYTGSELIEEEFGRAQSGASSAITENSTPNSEALAPQYEEPLATDEEPSADYEEPSVGYEEPATLYEETSAPYEEPLTSNSQISAGDTKPFSAYAGALTSDRDQEPAASNDQEPSTYKAQEPNNEATTILSSNKDQSLADAFSVIDDTPSFNIEDYRDSTLDNTESDPREAENENPLPQSSVDTIESDTEQNLNAVLSRIDETPSFRTLGYRASAVDDSAAAENLKNDNSKPRQAIVAGTIKKVEPDDDSLSAYGLSKTQDSPILPIEDDTSSARPQAELLEADIQDSKQLSETASNQIGGSDMALEEADQTLITKVDQLIEEKLVVDSLVADESDIIDFSNTSKRSALSRWVYGPGLVILALLLVTILGYQLWLKQATPLLESPRLAKVLEPVTKPLKKQLEEYQLNLPERRNLNQLELLSARTEAHPTRSSTILLRTSIVNRATISQPFPWLELSLTDEGGRLVSRRALSPKDYLHNNRMENRINTNELKQVTIELLAFPKQAHGFELRLLNK